MRKYRYYYHYYRQYKCMSVHFRGRCLKARDIVCSVPSETKWNTSQPNLVVQGFASSVELDNEVAYIK